MSSPAKTLHRGRHLELVERDGWEYTTRRQGHGVVAVVALTVDHRLVLVEQRRPPLDRTVLELPAGLVGDDPNRAAESAMEAGRRELLEETGFGDGTWSGREVRLASSGGLTDEVVTVIGVFGVRRLAAGGGVEDERIDVHLVPLDDLESWLADRSQRGTVADGRVWAARALLGHLRID